MPAYLVREAGTTIVCGIFWADNLKDLWWAVDEMGDPAEFEYFRLRAGGLYSPRPLGEGWRVKQSHSGQDDETDHKEWPGNRFPFDGFEMSEELADIVTRMEQAVWRRFPFADKPGGGIDQIVRQARGRSQ